MVTRMQLFLLAFGDARFERNSLLRPVTDQNRPAYGSVGNYLANFLPDGVIYVDRARNNDPWGIELITTSSDFLTSTIFEVLAT